MEFNSDNPFEDTSPLDNIFNKNNEESEDNTSKEQDKKPKSSKEKDIVLEDWQKDYLLKNCNKEDLMDMVRHIFNNPNLTGRHKEGVICRNFLKANKKNYKTTKVPKKEEITLSNDQEEYAINHAHLLKPHEIARLLFKNEKIHQWSKEALAVRKAIKRIKPELLKNDDELTDKEYSPPKDFSKTLQKVNEVTNLELDEKKIKENAGSRKQIEALMKYLRAPRLLGILNNLNNKKERDMFEAEFIRCTWDKPDLTAEELNLYMNIVNEYIIQDRIQKIIAKLNNILEEITDDSDGKISISLADAIKGKSEEYNSSVNRQKSLVTDVAGKRSSRIDQKIKSSKSIVALVEAFQEEKERKNMIRLAEIRQKTIKEEKEKLEGMPEFQARIFGLSEEELMN